MVVNVAFLQQGKRALEKKLLRTILGNNRAKVTETEKKA